MPRRCTDIPLDDDSPKKKNCNVSTMSSFALKPDEYLRDLTGKEWKLGKAVGVGGFGEIYLASDNLNEDVKTDSLYVAKVESHKNGPLFVEVNCYLRIAKANMIEEWKKQKKIRSLGIPHYVASGSHMHKGERYRFLILPKFDKDLEKVLENNKTLNIKTVLTISMQIIDVLEYIHSKGYIHSDIKASNILLGKKAVSKKVCVNSQSPGKYIFPIRSCRIKKSSGAMRNLRPQFRAVKYNDDIPELCHLVDPVTVKDSDKHSCLKDQVYLLDYGLASKFLTSQGEHKPFGVDQRKAHAGTILFCSRDAHKGVPSRRSDLESLGYNMIYWLTGNLPWSSDVDNPEIVDKKKQKCMMNIEYFLETCFAEYPKFLLEYFQYLQNLKFEEKPDYSYCKRLFTQSIKDNGYKNNSHLDLDKIQNHKLNYKKRSTNENEKMKKFIPKVGRPPLQSNIPVKPSLRKKVKNNKFKRRADWFKVLVDPEVILKQARRNIENTDSNLVMNIADMNINRLNPTYAMIEVYNKCRERLDASPTHKGDSCIENVNGYTHAMMSVLERMKKRKELEFEHLAVNLSNSRSGRNIKRCINKRKRKFESLAKSPPQTRTSKSVTVVKKEQFQSRKIKSFVFRRTYSLRG